MVYAVSVEDKHVTSNFEDEIDVGETDDEDEDLDCINLENSTCPASKVEPRSINLFNPIKLFVDLFIHTSSAMFIVNQGAVVLFAFLNHWNQRESNDENLEKSR